MNKIMAVLLFVVCAAILVGFPLQNQTYWFALDIVIFIVSLISGILLLKK